MTRKTYLVIDQNDRHTIMLSNRRPYGYKEVMELSPAVHAHVYDIFVEEDGTCVALLSETKLANYIDEQKRIAWENGWDFSLDLNL